MLCKIFVAILLVFICMSEAQQCREPRNHVCTGEPHRGHGGRHCVARRMWYYNHRTNSCHEFHWLGCGGNRNNHCEKAECERRCRRVFPNPPPPQ